MGRTSEDLEPKKLMLVLSSYSSIPKKLIRTRNVKRFSSAWIRLTRPFKTEGRVHSKKVFVIYKLQSLRKHGRGNKCLHYIKKLKVSKTGNSTHEQKEHNIIKFINVS